MKRRNKIILILIVSVIIISNLPPVTYFLQEKYYYQNRDGSFHFSEQGGPTQGFEIVISRFETFKNNHPENPNKVLYRTFKVKPWRFWEWREMIGKKERFDLPYFPKKILQ